MGLGEGSPQMSPGESLGESPQKLVTYTECITGGTTTGACINTPLGYATDDCTYEYAVCPSMGPKSESSVNPPLTFHYNHCKTVDTAVSKSDHHRQRGSDCTVLTATGLVNGEWQILTPVGLHNRNP